MTRITAPAPTRGPAPSHSPPDVRFAPGAGLARALGWFSIGLGLTEVVAHRRLAEMIGVRDHPVLLPLLGVREILSGIGILSEGRPTGWLWSRVAGDAMDLALLGAALMSPDARRERVAAATAAVAGVTALDVLCSAQLSAAAAVEG
jgi:hypothetical protein